MKIPSRTGVTAGVTTGSPPDERSRGRRRRAVVAGLVASGLVGTSLIMPGIGAAAVPAFPDNVVVFPDRDFITIEGYQDHVGEVGLVEVKRDGKVIGSAKGKAEAGDVAFEINHPGGYCWGADTGLAVTPDIKPGDVASVTWPDGSGGDTTVSSAMVTEDAALNGSTLTVTGTVGPDVNTAQMEQRIINPDLVPTAVAKRDIRAVSGPLTPAPKGGYSSSLTFDAGTFTATYVFDDPAVATIASKAALGERAMSWQEEDADGNRQGLTIAEFGEAGGPGMGGCPLGPADQASPAGSYSAVRSTTDKSQYAVSWTPATPAPGAAPVTGYSVDIISKTVTGGVATTYGARTDAAGTKATITVDAAVADYTVEVRSLTGPKMGEPFTLATTTPTTGSGGTGGDTTAPKLSVTPAPNADPAIAVETNQVTLASESGSDIYFTTDGSPAVTGDLPGDTAKLYTAPIPITAINTEVNAVAFDRAGNIDTFVGLYSPSTAPAPDLAAPATLTAAPGQGSVKLDWAAVTGATSYQVSVSPVVTPAPASTTARTQTITGLTAGTAYTFTVAASDGTRTSVPSPTATATPTPVLARVVISTGRWKNADMRIQGTTDTGPAAGTIRFYRVAADGKSASTTTVGGTAGQVLTAAVAPATGSTFDARYRTTALTGTTNPGTIVAVLSDSTGKVLGTSAPFTLANG
jgi:hypothetical protein